MKFAALIAAAAAHNISDEVETAYLAHMAEHGKSYGTKEEYEHRLGIFAKNARYVELHNAITEKDGEHAHRVGLNHMADWTEHEYAKIRGYKKPKSHTPRTGNAPHHGVEVPASVDWRAKGAVTPVKNQGQCGSCWSFSTTGSVEGRWQIAGNALTAFSEQQLMDCSGSFGNKSCNGGLMDDAFKYLEANKLETEADYPYTAKDGTCHAQGGVTKISSYQDVKHNDPVDLKAAVATGPVSVAIDAAGIGMQLYFGGIIKHFCGTSLDHGVLVVGYGSSSSGEDYWILKNSWGSGWGEKGFFRIFRDDKTQGDGVCGLQEQPSYPIF